MLIYLYLPITLLFALCSLSNDIAAMGSIMNRRARLPSVRQSVSQSLTILNDFPYIVLEDTGLVEMSTAVKYPIPYHTKTFHPGCLSSSALPLPLPSVPKAKPLLHSRRRSGPTRLSWEDEVVWWFEGRTMYVGYLSMSELLCE